MKQYFLSFFLITFLLFAQFWLDWPDQGASLIFCDVGQGDATLITSGSNQILIDGGRQEEGVLTCMEENIPFWDRTLELMIVTHADADHIGGLPAVLERYHVKEVIANSYHKETAVFRQLKEALAKELRAGSVLKNPILGQQLVFSQVETINNQQKEPINSFLDKFLAKNGQSSLPIKLTILSPQVESQYLIVQTTENPETILSDVETFFSKKLPINMTHNELSIVTFLEVNSTKTLLMADLEQLGELSLLKRGLLNKVDILKIGHHGAKTSSSYDFIETTRPEISVISVGANNSYGHPAPQVLDILSEFESHIVRTDESGTVKVTIDRDRHYLNTKIGGEVDF